MFITCSSIWMDGYSEGQPVVLQQNLRHHTKLYLCKWGPVLSTSTSRPLTLWPRAGTEYGGWYVR